MCWNLFSPLSSLLRSAAFKKISVALVDVLQSISFYHQGEQEQQANAFIGLQLFCKLFCLVSPPIPNRCVLTVLRVEQCNDDTLWRGVGQSVGEPLHSHLPTCKSSQRIGNLKRLYLLLRSARYLAIPEGGGGGSLKTRVTRSRRKEGVDRFGRESRRRWSPAEGSP